MEVYNEKLVLLLGIAKQIAGALLVCVALEYAE
jgi:hypothetical protein